MACTLDGRFNPVQRVNCHNRIKVALLQEKLDSVELSNHLEEEPTKSEIDDLR